MPRLGPRGNYGPQFNRIDITQLMKLKMQFCLIISSIWLRLLKWQTKGSGRGWGRGCGLLRLRGHEGQVCDVCYSHTCYSRAQSRYLKWYLPDTGKWAWMRSLLLTVQHSKQCVLQYGFALKYILIYNEDCYCERLRIACLLFCSCVVFGAVSKFSIFNSGLWNWSTNCFIKNMKCQPYQNQGPVA